MSLKHHLVGAGLKTLAATRLHRLFAPLARGHGAILMFHHVRPFVPQPFAPNRGLDVTPEHLDVVLITAKAAGYRIVPLEEVPSRLASRASERFVAITFDDGYRDNLVHALPVLERHAAPCTIFVTTGFAERTARLWWLELEALLRKTDAVQTVVDGRPIHLRTSTLPEKAVAFSRLATMLMRQPSAAATRVIDTLGGDPAEGRALVEALCLDWNGIAALAGHPLVTIGGHTATHPCLAALDLAQLSAELSAAKACIEDHLGRPVTQLAYPYGSAAAAGSREFAAAADAGYAMAVTTRPGILDADHAGRLTALPRLSVNGHWQSRDAFEILLSGVPFALWNRGRRA